MILAKYNEIMEYIKVTEDMQRRILKNVEKHFPGRRVRRRVWLSIIGSTAAVAVILLVINQWGYNPSITNPNIQEQPPVEGGVYNMQEYGSADELSDAVGFTISDLTNIPFEFSKALYYNNAGRAEIQYIGNEETLIFLKSVGTEDNSGDYNDYPLEKNVSIKNIQVTMKGKNKSICLAVWTDGEYSYSLLSENGMDERSIIRLVKEIIEK